MGKKQELTLEEKEEKVRDFRPIDDAFFETLADDIAFCQEILRVILSDKKLVVEDVIVQNSKRNLYGRSVRLDALCTLGNGTKCNIEVQRSNNDNHLKRVRYNAASIAVVDSQRGDKFRELEDLYVVYISEFDVFHGGYTKYHVDSVVRETGKKVKDGLDAVCDVMERYEEIAAEKALEKANIKAVKNMIKVFQATKRQILQIYSEKEYEQAVKELKEEEDETK